MSAIENVKNLVNSKAGRSLLKLRKYSPDILTGVGIVGVVGSAVMASRATLKLEPLVDDLRTIREGVDLKAEQDPEYVGSQERVRDLTVVYMHGAVQLTKLYGPAVSLGVASIGCILGAHGIMKRRNVALLAAYKVVEEGFTAYRNRVQEELGEDRERELRFGTTTHETKNEETGKKEKVKVLNRPNDWSTYARFFDQTCNNWSKSPETNMMTLKQTERYFNQRLDIVGHVFLNEIYDALGMPRSQAGAICGWVSEKSGTKGDGFIDFNIHNPFSEAARAFVNGDEAAILLDFNVDGIIYDQI